MTVFQCTYNFSSICKQIHLHAVDIQSDFKLTTPVVAKAFASWEKVELLSILVYVNDFENFFGFVYY